MNKYITLSPSDNVAVAVANLSVGDTLIIDGNKVVIATDIPTGHKFALLNIGKDENI